MFSSLLFFVTGIGKSWFAAYILHKLSKIQKDGQVLIWCSQLYKKTCIFKKDGTVEIIEGAKEGMDYVSKHNYLHNPNTYVIADDVEPIPSFCCTILLSSPNENIYKDFEKELALLRYKPSIIYLHAFAFLLNCFLIISCSWSV